MTAADAPSPPVSIRTVLGTLPDAPIATTRGRDWRGVTLDMHAGSRGYAVVTPAHDHHLICYCPAGRGRLAQQRGGLTHRSVIASGMSIIMPAGMDSVWEGDAPASARIRMPPPLIVEAAEQIGRRAAGRFEIRNRFEARDPMIARIAHVLMSELERAPHPAQALIAESMSCALAAHMLRNHNGHDAAPCREGAPLGTLELARIIAYVEENLDRPIGLAELAAIVHVSRFHFSRLFKQSTGGTAIRFVEQCRIRRAQSLIADSDMPLSEVALMAGFADQSHFTRRFHRHVGCIPSAYARDRGRRRTARSVRDGRP